MSDIETRLEELYLQCLPPGERPFRGIHPRDEMYLWAGDLGVPVPQRRLQYMAAGREILFVLRHIARTTGRDLADMGAILDFASGFGRVARFLCAEAGADRVWCCDALHDAMDWLRDELGVHTIRSHSDPAEVDLERRYDVIWVGSLFTHLPRRRFGAWLARLFEALEPEGLLIFTTHGEQQCQKEQRDPSGFTFVRESESRTLSLDEYGATYVNPTTLEAIAREAGIPELYSVPCEAWGRHDVQVAAKRPLAGLAGLEHAPRVLGAVQKAEVRADRHGWVGGWAIASSLDPLESVELRVEGLPPTPALLGPAQSHDRGAFLHTQWYLEGPLAQLAPGQHALIVVGRTRSGQEICFDGCALEVPG